MYITIKNSRDTDEKAVRVWFPCEEDRLSRVCDEVGIVISKDKNCFIVEGSDRDFIDAMKDSYCNVDELNFLTKRLDSFDAKERNIFYAATVATDAKTMTDLINLTYNTHCYSVISDFNNLDEVGKDVYLNEAGGVSVKELEELDGRAIAEEIMKNSPIKAITNYGVVYQNRNEPELVYDGKHFPLYYWKDEIAMIELSANGEKEYLYLPCSDTEISKALIRLEVDNLTQCDALLESDYFPENMIKIITKDKPIVSNMESLNEFANKFKEMGKQDESYFEKLIDYIGPRNETDLKALLNSMYEFEMFDKIKNAEQYGRYMICDSGHFKYDENLEEYIDFKNFGEQKINNEHGAFTEKGYIVYYGYNEDLKNLLSENLGLMIERKTKPQELKLYMPLKITTYDVENDYGYMERSDYEEELSSSEALIYTDKILDAIEKNKLPEEEQRGLMKYYRNCDSVNAKVSKYEFTVDEVKGELMGVAVLTLNDALNEKELEIIKSEISGQASSKYVLTDLMVCAECGHAYRRQTWSKYGKKSAVWRCEDRLKNGTSSKCKNSPTLKEEQLHDAIMNAINDVVENSGDFIETFRENVIRVIGNYSTEGITTEYDDQIEVLQKQMLKLIEDNAKQGAVSEDFDEAYRYISEQINELKKAKIKLVQAQKQVENYKQRVEALDKAMSTVNPKVREFDQELVKRLIQSIRVHKGMKIEIQFHSGIVMMQEVDYYED